MTNDNNRTNRINSFRNLFQREQALEQNRSTAGFMGANNNTTQMTGVQDLYAPINWTTGTTSTATIATNASPNRWGYDAQTLTDYTSALYARDTLIYTENVTQPFFYDPIPPLTEEQLVRIRRNEKVEAIRQLYRKWSVENKHIRGNKINSAYQAYKHQPWSIEHRLLAAISNNIGFMTKTTEYSPSTNKVYLFGHEIAKVSEVCDHITHVTFPVFTETKDINLFRHRLRQLGLRCRIYSGKTRIYFPDGKDMVLVQGERMQVPPEYRTSCLPAGLARLIPEDRRLAPQQLLLDLVERNEKKKLDLHDRIEESSLETYCDFELTLVSYYDKTHLIRLQVEALPINSGSYPGIARECFRSAYSVSAYEQRYNSPADYPHVISLLREQVRRAITEKYGHIRPVAVMSFSPLPMTGRLQWTTRNDR